MLVNRTFDNATMFPIIYDSITAHAQFVPRLVIVGTVFCSVTCATQRAVKFPVKYHQSRSDVILLALAQVVISLVRRYFAAIMNKLMLPIYVGPEIN